MFDHLIGNDEVKLTLKRLLAKGRVPSALLFAGDEGVGKRQFAIELAKAFVCTDPVDGQACGVCSACRRAEVFIFPKDGKKEEYEVVFFSEHPDVGAVIPRNRNILVEAIRELEREANFRPYEARARFFIIDDADKMNDNAANALLKTLEEPPETSYIFLITSRPDALLPTIRSRCQTLRFSPVATNEIEEFLIRDRAYSHDEAKVAARSSRGSIGRALSVDVPAFKAAREKMITIVRSALAGPDRAAMMRIGEEMNDAKNKDNFEENIDILESVIHDVWTVATVGETDRIVNVDIANELARLASDAEPQRLTRWLADIEQMRMDFAVNINRKIAVDSLFVKMASA